ncbi:class I SAM-dependent methyltransferase [Bradyrhizobium jicamae]|nr:class I SAM-dependent methyltransferase [Bradyrhizobium jicamae]
MSLSEQFSRLTYHSLGDAIRSVFRFGVRALSSTGSALGSYAVLPLDHRAVVSPTSGEFVYGQVRRRIAEQDAVYDTLLRAMSPHTSLAKTIIQQEAQNETTPFWDNAYFHGNDASAAWALTALMRPRLIVEIGSGNSTKFFRHAIEYHGLSTRLACVDPAPRAEIDAIADEIHYETVQRTSTNVFTSLEPGDILFFDGSHLVVQGCDTQYVFLEILPLLPKGVLVHVHDVNLPYEYRSFYNSRLYGEQYLLAALLLFSPDWKPVLPVYWLEKTGRLTATEQPAASFWITNDLDFLIDRITTATAATH